MNISINSNNIPLSGSGSTQLTGGFPAVYTKILQQINIMVLDTNNNANSYLAFTSASAFP
jgi:hypothetical protein